LNNCFLKALNQDVRNHTATLLLELGSRAGLPHLFSMLKRPDGAPLMAALVLGKAGIKEAAPMIREVLDKWNCIEDPYGASTLIGALRKLGAVDDGLREAIRTRWPRNMTGSLESLLRE
jgi:HEAT repeat protein